MKISHYLLYENWKEIPIKIFEGALQWNSFAYWWHYMIWKCFFKPAFYIYSKFCFYIHGKGLQKLGCNIYSHIILCNNIQFSSDVQSCLTLCDPMGCSMPCFPVLYQLPKLAQTHVHQVSDVIQPPHPLLNFILLPSILPSIRVFSNTHCRVLELHFSIIPSNEYSVLPVISFKIDLFVLLAVQGTLKNLINTIVWKHQFFGTELLYIPTFTSIHVYWKSHSFD